MMRRPPNTQEGIMTELNAGPPASILEMGGTAHTRAMLAMADSGTYYCRLYNEALGLDRDPAPWQGPFEATAPETAAAQWVRQEWDCRHNENIRVAVKRYAHGISVVRLQTKVKITALDICHGPTRPAA